MALFTTAAFFATMLHAFKCSFILLERKSKRFLLKSKVTQFAHEQMNVDSTHGIGLYCMEQCHISISDVQLIPDGVAHPQDQNKTFVCSEQDSSLPDLCNYNDSDHMLPGNLQ